MDDAIDRSAYVQALNSSDKANLEALVATRTRIDAERERLAAERERLSQMKAEHEEALATVQELRQHRALQLAAASSEMHELAEEKEDLEEESQRIANLIKARQEAAARAASQPSGEAAVSSGAVSTSGYAWPRCDRVTSEFGYRWGRRHEGIDVDGDTGQPIFAAKDGVVISAGWHGGYGRLTLIDHGDGVVTAYAHQSAIAVGSGQRVSQGQRIGSVGSTGHSTGSHLHFETRVNGSAVNPRRFLPSSC
ncbi:MAG: peptidoglycan DD-metalloendopeptidase family protein [Actinobacteria bacterium]|nr:peptidoglycan DD-metalloendopeptidase family protein [Actinomycetota bacterium]